MTSRTNPLPPLGFGRKTRYYNKLNSKLKQNWDFRKHIYNFNKAIKKINLEINKMKTYKNSIEIKKKLLEDFKFNYLNNN